MNDEKIVLLKSLLKSALDILDPEQQMLKRESPQLRLDKPTQYDAICDKCGKNCTIPFKPKNDSPILCRECYKAKCGY